MGTASYAASNEAIARSERYEVLDGLRGFALFEILLANILGFSAWGSCGPSNGWNRDHRRDALKRGPGAP